MTAPQQNPDELARRISDGAELDFQYWSASASPEQAALLAFGEVARAFRRVREAEAQSAPSGPVLFRFGALEVERLVAEGRFGRVYRAFDRSLGVPVALKLAPEGAAQGHEAQRFLAEARRLARLRHPNVVAVYGAAIHDGAAGFWTEWIEGLSLEQYLREHGPLAPGDALALVRELGQALAFVHGHGLVHGDLKPGNVMRGEGGRVKLLDFGAAGAPEELAQRIALAGTRAYLAPEVSKGAVPDVATDLYAMAGVLTFLLGGGAPDEDPIVRLRQRRPELGAAVLTVLERALAPDPAQRYASAAELVAALEPVLAPPDVVSLSRWPRRALLAAGLLAAAGVATWALRPAPWETALTFRRHGGNGIEAVASGAALHLGDRVELLLQSSAPVWTYVVNEDRQGVATLLFPLQGLDRQNPLPAGGDATLPGARGGVAQQWQVTSAGGDEHFLVILARAPLPEAERLLSRWQQAASEAPDDRRALEALAIADSRGVAIEGARSRELARVLMENADARRDVRLYQYRFTSE